MSSLLACCLSPCTSALRAQIDLEIGHDLRMGSGEANPTNYQHEAIHNPYPASGPTLLLRFLFVCLQVICL